jgi:hypothetical protein
MKPGMRKLSEAREELPTAVATHKQGRVITDGGEVVMAILRPVMVD